MSPPISTPSTEAPAGLVTNGMEAALPVALDPAGPQAEPVATLSWILFAGGTVIFLIVVAALALALFGGEKWRGRLSGEALIIGGGLIFPIVVLSALLVYGLGLTASLANPQAQDPLRIEVVGEQWWWRVHYEGGAGPPLVSANEIYLPVGRTAILELRSADVIHSFWVPRLAGKLDMIPGKTNRLAIRADSPGVYYGACAEYCGGPHALMQFRVIALPAEEYEAWRARQAMLAEKPLTPFEAKGLETFLGSGCGACHTIRGTPADGTIGPDLTHVGSRRTLAAGILPNNVGTLAGWISESQKLKPNNKMPSYDVLSGEELRALATYLGGLE